VFGEPRTVLIQEQLGDAPGEIEEHQVLDMSGASPTRRASSASSWRIASGCRAARP
jgi:hypothetical protein